MKYFIKNKNIFKKIYSWFLAIFTPPRNRGGVIFSLQFVCVSVCVSGILVNKIPAERMHRPIWTRFSLNGCLQHWLGTYWNGDLGSKVKVTVTENVCKNDKKNSPKIHI